MAEKEGNIFGSGQKVDKIVFQPINKEMENRIKKVSEPAPRPLPEKIPTNQVVGEWTPKVDEKVHVGKKLVEGAAKVGGVLKYLIIGTLTIGCLAGIALLAKWVMDQYGLL